MNEIKYPSYWRSESGRCFFSAIEPNKCVYVLFDEGRIEYEISVMKNFEAVWFQTPNDLLPATQLEFMKAYNKAHEAIEELIISVKDPA